MANVLRENKWKPTAQIAHLQFTQAETQTNNFKRAIFLPNTQIQCILVF